MMRIVPAAAVLAAFAVPAAAQEAPALTIAEARASTAGAWEGQLQYLDYSSGKWEGIPVTVTVTLEGDRNTLTRRSVFDAGPRVGNVFITGMSMLGADGVTEYNSGFRAGRTPWLEAATLTLGAAMLAALVVPHQPQVQARQAVDLGLVGAALQHALGRRDAVPRIGFGHGPRHVPPVLLPIAPRRLGRALAGLGEP